jgi:hypothetical protein
MGENEVFVSVFPKTWYHGSPAKLSKLRSGSTITPSRDLARIFSHKPSLVVQDYDAQGRMLIKHSGVQSGWLYRIAEPLQPEDLVPHPRSSMEAGQEWLTCRELRLELLEATELVAEELLSAAEIADLQARLQLIRKDHV